MQTRVNYTGTTPGNDANAYTLFSTITGTAPNSDIPAHFFALAGIRKVNLDLKHSHTGTLKWYKSADRGVNWLQIGQQLISAPAATETTWYDIPVEGFADFKLDWVNGGSAQTSWVPDIALDPDNWGLFLPNQLTGLALWLRADRGIILNGGDVAEWDDLSGNGRHEIQAVGALQPTWIASDPTYAGKATLDMTGGEYMSSGAWAAALPQPFTAYVVGHAGSIADYRIYWGDTVLVNGPLMLAEATDGRIYEQSGATTVVSAVAGQAKHAICGVFNGAASAVYVDSATTAATGDPGNQTLSGVVVGSFSSLSFPLLGKLAEIIMYSGAHTASERRRVMTYLTRYGISLS